MGDQWRVEQQSDIISLNILAESLCCVEKQNGVGGKDRRRVTGSDTTAAVLQEMTVDGSWRL